GPCAGDSDGGAAPGSSITAAGYWSGLGVDPSPPGGYVLNVSRGSGHGAAPRAPQDVAQPGQDDQRTDRSEGGDHVVDGGDEVVCRVVERGREAPAVRLPGLSRRPGLCQRDRHRAVRGVVVEVLDLSLELLDLARDLADLVLHGDDVVDVLGLGQQGEHRVALRLGVGETGPEVDVL